MQKYAFIDRDGTLIFEPQDSFQIDSLEKLKILDGVIDGLNKLNSLGYKLIMVSNQNGVGSESFPQQTFEIPHNKMIEIFKDNGIVFDKIFVCPHLPSANCDCRKPKTGLVDDFLAESDIDKNLSIMIGDRETDRTFANNIGVSYVKMDLNGDFFEAVKHLN